MHLAELRRFCDRFGNARFAGIVRLVETGCNLTAEATFGQTLLTWPIQRP